MKKALIIAIYSLLSAAFFLAFPPASKATIMGVDVGDLIKIQNDHDPATHDDETVYYYDRDWNRRPFLNRRVFESWYSDFSGVKELTPAEIASIRMAAPIVYRPGTRLIKIPSVPKVYAVEPGGVLRWVTSEDVAKTLYGNDWSKRVDDVPESYFANYREGAPLTAPVWPSGTFVRRASDASLWYINGLTKRHVAPAAAEALRVSDNHVVVTSSDLANYADGADLVSADFALTDAAQQTLAEPLNAPLLDFPVTATAAAPGQEAVLYTLRLTDRQAVALKRIQVTLSGPLWNGSTPLLTDLKFVDQKGNVLFGSQELAARGSASETLTFIGSHLVLGDETSVIELRAKVDPAMPVGSKLTVSAAREQVRVANGSNSDNIANFYPPSSFPVSTLEIE